jgi:cysteine-rich repeat protein
MAAASVLLVCLVPGSAGASFHLMHVEEIFLGATGDPTAQYVVLRMTSAGQTLVSGHSIVFQDAAGVTTTTFGTFTATAANGAAGSRLIIGSASAATLFGLTFDATASGTLPPAGRVCWDNTTAPYDCVAYGAYTGSNGSFGTPAPAPLVDQALTRISDTDDNAVDFVACDPHPINNAGTMGGTSTTFCNVCPNGFVSVGETCDDNNAVNTDACLDTCATASCGDGFVRATPPAEQCDDGAANSDTTADACRTTCLNASCGDGVVDTGETCDDGLLNSDATPDACRTTCLPAGCGDGTVDTGEQCDDGAANSDTTPNACRTACVSPVCGDGVVDAGELCDDGNTTGGDGCSATCSSDTCGDGVVDALEECDDGAANSDTAPDACRTSCLAAFCGDGVMDTGEACDDGNASSTDACVGACVAATCGDGFVQAGAEECDEGAANSDTAPDACRTTCVAAACGDSVIDTAETCDDGNTADDDTCVGACVGASCGDGFVETGVEACDDGAANSDSTPDACRTTCVAASCGDYIVDSGEDCDDQNTSNTDGCLNTCQPATCGDGFVQDGVEECDPPGVGSCAADCTMTAGGTDAGSDAGTIDVSGGGCSCRVAGSRTGAGIGSETAPSSWSSRRTAMGTATGLLLGLALLLRRRRTR